MNDSPCTYSSDILGEKVNEVSIQTELFVNDISPAFVGKGDFHVDINFPFLEQKYILTIKVFEDYPVHKYGVLDAVPVPTNMLSIYACFSQEKLVENGTYNTKKYFDGYSHLGFFLADLPSMQEIIFKKYGTTSLDLVDLFTSTTLIDELFEARIIAIVWGINPYTYPIYSTGDVLSIKTLLGNEHEKTWCLQH